MCHPTDLCATLCATIVSSRFGFSGELSELKADLPKRFWKRVSLEALGAFFSTEFRFFAYYISHCKKFWVGSWIKSTVFKTVRIKKTGEKAESRLATWCIRHYDTLGDIIRRILGVLPPCAICSAKLYDSFLLILIRSLVDFRRLVLALEMIPNFFRISYFF